VHCDPILNSVVASRIAAVGTLHPNRLGGTVFGIREAGLLRSAVFAGGNVIPLGGDEANWLALAHTLSQRPRLCASIVGTADVVATMWPVLERRWGAPRAIRGAQPLLVADRRPAVASDPEVRRATSAELDRYMAASAAMFTDELGISPYRAPGVTAYRNRVADLISAGSAFARFDHRGQVEFKADIGVITPQTCQIQGVWVRPDLRGRGIATAAMATVLRHALTLAPTASLYVNDFNIAGRRLYAKLGMRYHATLATVLL
jgi:hypothetical protein